MDMREEEERKEKDERFVYGKRGVSCHVKSNPLFLVSLFSLFCHFIAVNLLLLFKRVSGFYS